MSVNFHRTYSLIGNYVVSSIHKSEIIDKEEIKRDFSPYRILTLVAKIKDKGVFIVDKEFIF